jgi:hypothetical protein
MVRKCLNLYPSRSIRCWFFWAATTDVSTRSSAGWFLQWKLFTYLIYIWVVNRYLWHEHVLILKSNVMQKKFIQLQQNQISKQKTLCWSGWPRHGYCLTTVVVVLWIGIYVWKLFSESERVHYNGVLRNLGNNCFLYVILQVSATSQWIFITVCFMCECQSSGLS